MKHIVTAVAVCTGLVGCNMETDTGLDLGPEPTIFTYTSPEQSGLVSGPAYPAAADVCRIIGENDLTRDYLDDSHLLIGCPKHERGAIADRLREGARIVGSAQHWTLMHVPQQ